MVCEPLARAAVEKVAGHATKAPPSMLHSKVAAGSFEVKVKSPVGSFVGLGSNVAIVVSGAPVSTNSRLTCSDFSSQLFL